MTEISSNSQEGKQIGQQEGKKVVIELDNVKRNFLVGDEVVHLLKIISAESPIIRELSTWVIFSFLLDQVR